MNNGRDCKHGQLARSCEICGLEAENSQLKAELAAMREQKPVGMFYIGHITGLYNPVHQDQIEQVKDYVPLYAAPGASPQPAHDSDCAQHNEPAYPNGPCDCSIAQPSQARELPERWVSESNRGHESQTYGLGYKSGWNDCLSQVAAINAKGAKP